MNPSYSLSLLKLGARLGLLGVLLHSSAGCLSPNLPMRPPAAEPQVFEVTRRVHERFDPGSRALLRRWHVTMTAEGAALLDGKDEGWWPDGIKRHERDWELGDEVGTWRSWYESSALRSLAEFESPRGVMRFWHSNGILSAEGLHEGGTRAGVWTFWRTNGEKSSSGPFLMNRREGAWTFWAAGGVIDAAGLYSAGTRVGEWLLAPSATELQNEE